MTKQDFGIFGMAAGALAGFFLAFFALPTLGAKTWPIFVLTAIATTLVVIGGAIGYKLVARPRPYEIL